MAVTAPRQTAEERREAVLDAATREFAQRGLHGASTDDIARAAGISQPYIFRLFGTKKDLYLAAAERCIRELHAIFEEAGRGKSGVDALEAMGSAYKDLMQDRNRLLLMLQSWGSADPDIRTLSRDAWRDLTELAERVSGEPPEIISGFFASGTLLTILMALDLFENPAPWGDRLIQGCNAQMGEE